MRSASQGWTRALNAAALLVAGLWAAGCGGNYGVDHLAVVDDVSGSRVAPNFGTDTTSGGARADAAGALLDSGTGQGGGTGDGGSGIPGGEGELGDRGGDASGGPFDAAVADALAGCGAVQACTQDSDCPAAACQVSVCKQGCCASSGAGDGEACDDSNPCTSGDKCQGQACGGAAKPCDDGKACTDESCDPSSGNCTSALQAGWCQIGGQCVQDGQASMASACKVCNSVESKDSWSLGAGCCTQDADCPKGGACDLPSCDLQTNQCGFKPAVGCCASDQDCSDGNACTLDNCDLTTGNCAYKLVECIDPSPCQSSTCDPKSGECKAATKAGWCLIDGACQSQGGQNPANGCQICDSLASMTGWTAGLGMACNDGNVCTFNDVCGVAGKCAGTVQDACCTSDADCAPSGNPCSINSCDLALGLCMPKAKPGCCTSGICCDVGLHAIKPAKTACGSVVLSTQYQCSGQSIQSREIRAGCDGGSADGCLTDAAHQAIGAWKTLQTCASNSKCTVSGTNLMPTCKATTLPGNCAGACNGKSLNGECYCDSACTGAGSCCADFKATCGCTSGECCNVSAGVVKAQGSACGAVVTEYQCVNKVLQKRTGQQACSGAASTCPSGSSGVTWSGWTTSKTCTSTQNCVVSADKISGSCKAIPAGSCNGNCGASSDDQCFCDQVCAQLGDCCGDYVEAGCVGVTACGSNASKTCKNVCGNQGSGLCWCDALCDIVGDCCPDKDICGCW